jgi:hypothetical protein
MAIRPGWRLPGSLANEIQYCPELRLSLKDLGVEALTAKVLPVNLCYRHFEGAYRFAVRVPKV